MDAQTAVENAARLLRAAEMETDLAKMERYSDLADSWLAMASLLIEQTAL